MAIDPAASPPIGLYPEGTVSRVDAAILFAGICKTRKMRRLPPERLASLLHLENMPTKSKSQSLNWEADRLDEQRIENRKDLRGRRWQCLAADPRERVPTSRSSSK